MARPPLRKSLGQHHLTRGELCQPIVRFLAPAGQRVVEIGAGGGVLTAELLAAGARVMAWDVDLPWALTLRARIGNPALRIVAGDALDLAWGRFTTPVMVAGNLPYNVATPLIERVLDFPERITRAAFLVQWEVGERLVARPGDRAYGALSVLTAARADASLLGRVRRGSFHPVPKVDGAFVGFAPRAAAVSPAEWASFARTVHLAFGQRRKTLRNALGAGWGRPEAERVLAAVGIAVSGRAEQLGVEEFVALHRAAAAGGDAGNAGDVRK